MVNPQPLPPTASLSGTVVLDNHSPPRWLCYWSNSHYEWRTWLYIKTLRRRIWIYVRRNCAKNDKNKNVLAKVGVIDAIIKVMRDHYVDNLALQASYWHLLLTPEQRRDGWSWSNLEIISSMCYNAWDYNTNTRMWCPESICHGKIQIVNDGAWRLILWQWFYMERMKRGMMKLWHCCANFEITQAWSMAVASSFPNCCEKASNVLTLLKPAWNREKR